MKSIIGGETMKRKIITVLLSLVFMFSTGMTVMAADAVGISAALTSEKTAYSANEDIDLKLTVTNANKYGVDGIQTKITLPDGIKLKSGSLTQNAFSLEAGKSAANDVIAIKQAETQDYTVPDTGAGSQLPLWAALMVISGSALAVVIIRNKKGKTIASLILCAAVIGTMAMPTAVEAEDKSFTALEDLTVDGKKMTFTAEVTYGYVIHNDVTVTNGTGTGTYAEGDVVTITADNAPASSTFTGWTVESGEATLADATKITTTFTMPSAPVTVKANYTAKQYSLIIKNQSGTLSLKRAAGEKATLVAGRAPEHCHFDKWIADGGTIEDASAATTTFTMPASNANVIANYTANEYTLTLSASKGGTISPSGTVKLKYGDTKHIEFDADDGYYIKSITSGGQIKETDDMPTSASMDYVQNSDNDETISVEFAKRTYTITTTNCTITVDGKTVSSGAKVAWGSHVVATENLDLYPHQTFHWIPTGITVSNVSENPLEFDMPKNAVNLKAQFWDD
ncbi:MAG: hypothetical protein LKF53_03140 [Solobacterium sp.]|nr:hypothetical protein [Solobacterium sp.]MCH4205374.1 hypothetical protein [Solobacterium sp.]MCH4226929.1 hypothetical protein [Solobacterium sp.]MCH4282279.1 hypothetical protein [Solobacterium sp.]